MAAARSTPVRPMTARSSHDLPTDGRYPDLDTDVVRIGGGARALKMFLALVIAGGVSYVGIMLWKPFGSKNAPPAPPVAVAQPPAKIEPLPPPAPTPPPA